MAAASATGKTLYDLLRDPTDTQVWERFVSRYAPKLKSWCRQWGLREHASEDVTQEVLRKLLECLHNYDPRRGRFRSWLKATARRTKSDWLTEQRRAGLPAADDALYAALDRDGDAVTAFEAALDRIFDMEVLQIAADRVQLRVGRDTWEAFRRVQFDQTPAQQVAEDLGLTVTAVYQAVYRVRQMLKAEIIALEGDAEAEEVRRNNLCDVKRNTDQH